MTEEFLKETPESKPVKAMDESRKAFEKNLRNLRRLSWERITDPSKITDQNLIASLAYSLCRELSAPPKNYQELFGKDADQVRMAEAFNRTVFIRTIKDVNNMPETAAKYRVFETLFPTKLNRVLSELSGEEMNVLQPGLDKIKAIAPEANERSNYENEFYRDMKRLVEEYFVTPADGPKRLALFKGMRLLAAVIAERLGLLGTKDFLEEGQNKKLKSVSTEEGIRSLIAQVEEAISPIKEHISLRISQRNEEDAQILRENAALISS